MTHQEKWDAAVASQEQWEREAYVRDMVNQEGQVYGRVYDRNKLTTVQESVLTYGPDGNWQRDVWSQISFIN
jgi:hypothetical protein